ncbi:MAG: uracil-DNA glycosylase [Gammaproteobacteria bacterium]|nr:uracil-DNA glycosylase [Gammaproteobacteria bacterium]
MSEAEVRRRAYLQAMGIEIWAARTARQPVADASPSQQHIDTSTDSVTVGHAAASSGAKEPSSSPSNMDWDALEYAVQTCKLCSLHKGRIRTVFGVGSLSADWMFVGEAPGAEEDRQGIAFVGRAGQLLTSMLSALGLKREQVYITNVLKCRPPNNRDPMGEEVVSCEPYLHRQVTLIEPSIIVALGRFAAQSLLKTSESIGKLRGQCFSYGNGIPLIVSYHPAYLLRNPIDKRKAWEDLCRARALLGEQ